VLQFQRNKQQDTERRRTNSTLGAAKEVEVNGVRLQYIEQGSGEPIVFVHGAPHDLRAWEPVRQEIAKRYRFIVYTQRTEPWPDEGKNFSSATHADDLAKCVPGAQQVILLMSTMMGPIVIRQHSPLPSLSSCRSHNGH